MTIGIDIDDTITNTTQTIKKYLALFDSTYTDYRDLPKEKYVKFLTRYHAQIMKTCPLKEYVKEAFAYFKKNHDKIIIITARDNKYCKDAMDITKRYLKNQNLSYDKIIFSDNQKGKYAFENKIDLFIDDKETVLDDISKYNIKCLRLTNESDSKYKTFSNWHDIINYIKRQEETHGRKNYNE